VDKVYSGMAVDNKAVCKEGVDYADQCIGFSVKIMSGRVTIVKFPVPVIPALFLVMFILLRRPFMLPVVRLSEWAEHAGPSNRTA